MAPEILDVDQHMDPGEAPAHGSQTSIVSP